MNHFSYNTYEEVVKVMRTLLLTISALFIAQLAHATNGDSLKHHSTEPQSAMLRSDADESTRDVLKLDFKPFIGLGVGNLTFYGDIANHHRGSHFTVSRVATELRVTHPIASFLDFQFHTMFGRVSANERSLTNPARNQNFESRIRAGGIGLSYNFDHLLEPKSKRIIEPWVYVGLESMEFLSKTDLFDAHGNQYHYWSDGSIMSMAEDDPNAGSAIRVYRDYVYETDLREQNLDGLGTYPERTWAVPIGIGVNMYVTKNLRMRIGTTMHYTFTDLIDNISEGSTGGRSGGSKNDRILYSNFTLSYNIQPFGNKEDELEELVDPWREPLFAKDTFDTDGDGVVDFQDVCAYTPKDCQPVQPSGCAIDEDKDGVPDCRDEELGSAGPFVNEKGVTITEEMIELAFKKFKDSTGEYSDYDNIVTQTILGEKAIGSGQGGSFNADKEKGKEYFVILDQKEVNIKANELYKYLSNNNFETIQSGDSVYYVLSGLDLAQASSLNDQLAADGIKTSGVGTKDVDDKGKTIVVRPTRIEIESALDELNGKIPELPTSDSIVYRVQIGAYSREQSPRRFFGIPDVVQFLGEDGRYRYFSGHFNNLQEASKHKIVMLSEAGFPGAFVVAFKDGKRISLKEVTQVTAGYDEGIDEFEKSIAGTKKEKIYRIQVGAYKDVPTEMLDLYLSLGNVKQFKEGEVTRYLIGGYKSREEAKQAAEELGDKGIQDAFVIIDYDGKLIELKDEEEFFKDK